jgi:phage terminase large subunit-like protein
MRNTIRITNRIDLNIAHFKKNLFRNESDNTDIRTLFNQIYDALYYWQKDTITATATHTETCLMAANRIGKTYLGTFMDAVHITGVYPDNWKGYKFTHPPVVWTLGYTGEKTRDLLQTPIFGSKSGNTLSGAMVPSSRIVRCESMNGTTGAMRSVFVEHELGESKMQFWSYGQGDHVLMGDNVDWFHIDEEPVDSTIYPQVITRTVTGGNLIDAEKRQHEGGRGILTFTPENGKTEMVLKFMENPSPTQFFIRKGWDDAPHLSEEAKASMLGSVPPHQRDMRTKGIPMLGHGRIFDMAEEEITVDPFEIPDKFKVIGGMDFGWDHPQAMIRMAIDLDTQTYYLTHAWSASKLSANEAWGATKLWLKNVPVAWPHDGLMHEKGRDDAKQQKDHYHEAGFNMLFDRATWDGKSNSVEQGILELRLLMKEGKFKVFKGCRAFFDEFSQYHRKENGDIVKIKDDVLDATRYAFMMRRFAKSLGELELKPKPIEIPTRENHW